MKNYKATDHGAHLAACVGPPTAPARTQFVPAAAAAIAQVLFVDIKFTDILSTAGV